MSLVKRLKPRDVPFPVGSACARSSPQALRGGQIPEERYPLVSKPPLQGRESTKVITPSDWKQLKRLISLQEDHDEERRARESALREASQQLKLSWGHTGKKKTDLIREMLEEARAKEEEEDLRAAEAIRLAKLEERQDYVRRAWEMLTREREEYGKLQGALLLSEVMSENERNLTLKKEMDEARKQREAEDIKRCLDTWDGYENTLRERANEAKNREKSIQVMQAGQIEAKKVLREQEQESSLETRRRLEDLDLKLTCESHRRTLDRKDADQELKAEQRKVELDAIQRRSLVADAMRRDLEKARLQDEEFLKRKQEYEEIFAKRRIDIGRRQEEARKWLRKNVLPKKEELDLRQERKRKEAQDYDAQREQQLQREKETYRRKDQEEVREFVRDFLNRKQETEEREKAEKLDDRQRDADKLDQHLDALTENMVRQEQQQRVHRDFWTAQVQQSRTRAKAVEEEEAAAQVKAEAREAAEEAAVAEHAEALASGQRLAGKSAVPLEVAKASFGRSGGAVLIAADSSGIRLRRDHFRASQCETFKDTRERLSLNWDP